MKISLELLPYQMKILKSGAKFNGFIGGTGSGKTFMIPTWLIYHIYKYPDEEWIVSSPTTAMMKRTTIKYILRDFDRWKISYEYNKSDMILEMKGATIYFISAETPDRMQGIHPKGIVGDEAGLYSKEWWDTAIQRISFKQGQMLLTTTPYSPNHWLKTDFWDRWKNGDKDIVIVNPTSLDNPFYPKEEYEKAKRKLPKWKFKLLYEAKFPEQGENALFRYDSIDVCVQIDENEIFAKTEDMDWYITVDVAREGNDESAIVIWQGYVMKEVYKYETNSITELAGKVLQFEKMYDNPTVVVDSTGLGAGLYDMLYDAGIDVIGVNFAEKAYEDKMYANIRAEMYHNLADAVENRMVKLINDDYLKDDLLVQERLFNHQGKIAIVPKEKLKKEIGRSPDLGDAVALRFAKIHHKVGIV